MGKQQKSQTNTQPTTTANAPRRSTNQAPRDDGYTDAPDRVEVAGYWNPEAGPIEGKVVDAYEYIQRSGKGRGQTRTMFVIDLLKPCVARVKVEGGGLDETTLEPRELCGVMGSIGLRQLLMLGGAFVKIERLGKKTLGNGNEMWSFRVGYKGKGKPLTVRPAFRGADPVPSNGMREPGDDTEADQLPF